VNELADAALAAMHRCLLDGPDGALCVQLAVNARGATVEVPVSNERSARDMPARVTQLRPCVNPGCFTMARCHPPPRCATCTGPERKQTRPLEQPVATGRADRRHPGYSRPRQRSQVVAGCRPANKDCGPRGRRGHRHFAGHRRARRPPSLRPSTVLFIPAPREPFNGLSPPKD